MAKLLGNLSTALLLSVALLLVVLFGMLSYLEPALLFVIAITVLGEPLEWTSLASYACIWAAIAVMLQHGWQRIAASPKNDTGFSL